MENKKKNKIVLVLIISLLVFSIFINANVQSDLSVEEKVNSEKPNTNDVLDYYIVNETVSGHLWSPDGTKLAYVKCPTEEQYNCELWVANFDPKGVKLINEKPYVNAHGDLVAFLHPKSTFGVLIELMQKKECRESGPGSTPRREDRYEHSLSIG